MPYHCSLDVVNDIRPVKLSSSSLQSFPKEPRGTQTNWKCWLAKNGRVHVLVWVHCWLTVVACCITERADTLPSLQKSVSDLQIVQLIIMHYALMWHSTLVKAAFSVRLLVEHMAKYNKKTCLLPWELIPDSSQKMQLVWLPFIIKHCIFLIQMQILQLLTKIRSNSIKSRNGQLECMWNV